MLTDFKVAAEAVGTIVKCFSTFADAVSYVRELSGERAVSSSRLPAEVSEAFGVTVFAKPEQFADIRVCVSHAEAGIAATGSLLLDLSDQQDRSATSLAQVHAVFLKKSTIVPDVYALHDLVNRGISASRPSRLSITTGPSRTADIERVLTIGVHGPKELHVLVMEGD